MLVSVIVPVYNVEKYLKKCLDSIRNQTYHELEVIMIDDGSSDGSGKICDEYTEKYDNFHVIHKKNEGPGYARNEGLLHAKGEYVTFLDSDDYYDKDMISSLAKEVIKYDADLCKSGFRRVDSEGHIISESQYKKTYFNKETIRSKFLPRIVGSSPTKKDSIEMAVWGTLYKMSIIHKYKILFPLDRELISEDMVFNIDYISHSENAVLLDYVGYNYLYNADSLTTRYMPERFDKCCKFYLFVKEKLLSLGYDKDVIFRLDRIFFVYTRVCIEQEVLSENSNKYYERISNIKQICCNDLLKSVIDSYPVQNLGVSQRLFLFLVKKNLKQILFIILYIMRWIK